ALLKKNAEVNNLRNIEVSSLAISSKKQKLDLFIAEDNYGDHRVFADQKDSINRRRIPILSDSLDCLFLDKDRTNRPIKLIKIDTQGFEPYIIEGAKNIIEKMK